MQWSVHRPVDGEWSPSELSTWVDDTELHAAPSSSSTDELPDDSVSAASRPACQSHTHSSGQRQYRDPRRRRTATQPRPDRPVNHTHSSGQRQYSDPRRRSTATQPYHAISSRAPSTATVPSSTQPCIPPGSLNRVPAEFGWGKGANVSSAGWQVTLCDHTWPSEFQ